MKLIIIILSMLSANLMNKEIIPKKSLHNSNLIVFISKNSDSLSYYLTSFYNLKNDVLKNNTSRIYNVIQWKDTIDFSEFSKKEFYLLKLKPTLYNEPNIDSMIINTQGDFIIVNNVCLEYNTVFFQLYKRGFVADKIQDDCSVVFVKKW